MPLLPKSGDCMTQPAAPVPAFEYAMKILSKRSYAESEVRTKLKKKNYPAEEIENAITECKRYSFINDEMYARDYAAILNARGCGKLLIRRKLAMLKIDENFIEAALAETADSEFEAAKRSFDFKMRMLEREKNPFKKRQKLYAFMVNRGYSFDIIRQLLDDINLNMENDCNE